MDRGLLESQWTQVSEVLREKFSNLTEEDIRQINGRYDQLVAKLQEKYGYTRAEAEDRIRNWNFDRYTNSVRRPIREDATYREETYREDKSRRTEDSSALKWLLGLGIPLLLLGAYFLSTPTTTERNVPATTQDQAFVETPADRTISNNLRTLFLQQNNAAAIQNIQVTSRNGIVTLSGTVPNENVRDSIIDTTQNFSGVRQVINNLQVR